MLSESCINVLTWISSLQGLLSEHRCVWGFLHGLSTELKRNIVKAINKSNCYRPCHYLFCKTAHQVQWRTCLSAMSYRVWNRVCKITWFFETCFLYFLVLRMTVWNGNTHSVILYMWIPVKFSIGNVFSLLCGISTRNGPYE